MKIYVASSWRNQYQPEVVRHLKADGHQVYDFRGPEAGFGWSQIDQNWKNWSTQEYIRHLHNHPLAEIGFTRDRDALDWAEICVLVLPCGRSAHLEAGYAVGRGKQVLAYIPERIEPDLMYRWFTGIYDTLFELRKCIGVVSR